MQLRRNIRATDNGSVEITDRENLEQHIEQIQAILAKEFRDNGMYEVEISQNNLDMITEILTPFSCFLLGRLTTLIDMHKALYGENRLIPWIKKPENN